MKKHILENPYVLIFKGCDDGHVGLRFSSKDEVYSYLKSLEVFENVFENESKKNDHQTLIKLKKENPEHSLSDLFKGILQYHN